MNNENLISTIYEIKVKTIAQFEESTNETAVKQTVILRLLAELDWNIFDNKEVCPEYSAESGRIDYSLRNCNNNKVFIEAKKPKENLENHHEQLLNYSFKMGVPLAILTNGITWWFYLPLEMDAWKKRKFYTIDFENQSEIEIAEKLIQFLLKENVLSEKSIRAAEETLRNKNKERKIKESLPVVWKNLLNNPTSEFILLLATETEKFCGLRPEDNVVINFFKADHSIQDNEPAANDYLQSSPKDNARANNTKLYVTINGKKINEKKAIDTFIETIKEFGIDKVKRLQEKIKSGTPLISEKAFNVGAKKKYKEIPNTNPQLYIDINHSTELKKVYLEKIAEQLNTSITVKTENSK